MLKNNINFKIALKYVIYLNCMSLLIPHKFRAYPIILLLIFSLLHRIKSENKFHFSFKKVILVSFPYLIYLLSIFISLNFKDAFPKLSTMASIIAFPTIFGVLESSDFKIEINFLKNIFKTFIFSVLVFLILSFLFFWFQKFTLSQTIIHYSNLVNIGLSFYCIHPIYLSIYVGIAIMMLFYLCIESISKYPFTYFIFIVLLAIFLAILMRRGPILYLLISCSIFLYFYLKFKKMLLGVGIIALIIFTSIKYLPKYQDKNRFDDFTNSELKSNKNSSVGIRYDIYRCSIDKMQENLILGYGIGNVQKTLDECYKSKKMKIYKKNYNSHNQFFSIVLNTGIFGFLLYLISLIFLSIEVYKKKSIIGLSMLLFIILNFLTENVLERESGAIIYSFLISILIFCSSSFKTPHKTL